MSTISFLFRFFMSQVGLSLPISFYPVFYSCMSRLQIYPDIVGLDCDLVGLSTKPCEGKQTTDLAAVPRHPDFPLFPLAMPDDGLGNSQSVLSSVLGFVSREIQDFVVTAVTGAPSTSTTVGKIAIIEARCIDLHVTPIGPIHTFIQIFETQTLG